MAYTGEYAFPDFNGFTPAGGFPAVPPQLDVIPVSRTPPTLEHHNFKNFKIIKKCLMHSTLLEWSWPWTI
jgi:hypothetical protein